MYAGQEETMTTESGRPSKGREISVKLQQNQVNPERGDNRQCQSLRRNRRQNTEKNFSRKLDSLQLGYNFRTGKMINSEGWED